MSGIRLSVLDQSPIRKGGTAGDAISETLELAQLCDELGYGRYWLAEHHSTQSLASAAPEVLIGQVANRTKRIRVGSGGVMLTHYAPLHVAEQFRMLETLFPGRIDLGVGRAPGSDIPTARALGGGAIHDIDRYPDQLMDLYGFLTGQLPAGHPYHGITAQPAGEGIPELWLLGSSRASATYAAELGWAFCFAHFISSEGPETVLREYEAAFEPSPFLDRPRHALATAVTCAETDERASYLAWSRIASRVITRARGGQAGGVLPPEEAMALDYSEAEMDYVDYLRNTWAQGSPGAVRQKLEGLARDYGTEELVLVTITYDFEARKESYRLLANEFGLGR